MQDRLSFWMTTDCRNHKKHTTPYRCCKNLLEINEKHKEKAAESVRLNAREKQRILAVYSCAANIPYFQTASFNQGGKKLVTLPFITLN